MKNLSTVKVPKDDWTSLNRELDNLRDLLKSIPQDVVNYVPSAASTTTPALTDKYVLPSTVTLGASRAATGIKLTIPQTGLYLIDTHLSPYLSSSGKYLVLDIAVNGVYIPGTLGTFYTIVPPSTYCSLLDSYDVSFTQDFNAGDVVEVYGFREASSTGYINVDGTTANFIQYTQLSNNVPVVATLGQDAWVGPMQDLTVSSRGVAKVDGMTKVKFRKDSGGNWFAAFYVCETVASGSRTGQQWYTDLVFKAAPSSCYHSLAGNCMNGIPLNYCCAYPSLGRIDIYHSSGTTTSYGFNGEVPLASKPVGYSIPDGV